MTYKEMMKDIELSSVKSPSTNQLTDSQFKVYRTRWLMLAILCVLNLSNAMMWITFAAAADTSIVYFNISSFQLNMLTIVFLIAMIPLGFVASWVLDTHGLRISLILSAWLNGLGGLLRNLSTFDFVPDNRKYTVVLIGQILTACAQPFVMFAPTKLAAVWFPENRRATANMIGSIMNPLGNLLAFVIVPIVVETPDDIPLALWIVSGPAFLMTLVTTLCVRSQPPSPPSASAAETTEPFFVGLKQLIRNKNYLLLNLSFGAGLALYTALASFLEQIMCPRGYSDEFAGICGALMIGLGVIFSGIAGVYVDRTKNFDEVVKISFSLAVLAGIVFTQVSRLRDQHVWVGVSAGLFGGFGLAIYPISMELAVEITYPVAEATSSGLCIVSGQIQGIIYMFAMQYLTIPLSGYEKQLESGCHMAEGNSTAVFTPEDWTYSNLYIFNTASTAAVLLLLLYFQADYKRLAAETKAEGVKNVSASTSSTDLAISASTQDINSSTLTTTTDLAISASTQDTNSSRFTATTNLAISASTQDTNSTTLTATNSATNVAIIS